MALFQELKLSPGVLVLVFNITMLALAASWKAVMATPVLMPLVARAGMDPVHFGVIFVLNIMIGTITPPVGCSCNSFARWEMYR